MERNQDNLTPTTAQRERRLQLAQALLDQRWARLRDVAAKLSAETCCELCAAAEMGPVKFAEFLAGHARKQRGRMTRLVQALFMAALTEAHVRAETRALEQPIGAGAE
jgi:hypothetical protein